MVKRSEAGMVTDPVTCRPDNTLAQVDALCARFRISGLPVVDDDGALVGIITNRDMRFEVDQSKQVAEVMTKAPLITAQEGVSASAALGLLRRNKIEKLPSGTLSLIFLVSWLEVSAVAGTTSEAAGNNKTSSNVSPSIATLCGSSPPVGTGSVVRPPMRTYGLTTRSELSSRPDMPRDIGGALHTHVFSEKPILSARNRPVTMRAAALAEKNRTITPRRGCASVWSARHEARTQFLALSPRACVV